MHTSYLRDRDPKGITRLSPADRFPTLSRLARNSLRQLGPATSAPERSAARLRSVGLTTASSIFAKAISLLTAVTMVPLTLRYLGPDRYGLWMTITSLVLFLTSADLGLGSGLTIQVAEAFAKNDLQIAKEYISSAFFILLAIAAISLFAFWGSYPHIPWQSAYHTTTALASSEAGIASAVLVVCTAVAMPLGTVSRVQLGYQRGYVSDLWIAFGNISALAGLFFATRAHLGLPWLVGLVAGCPALATLANWISQFGRRTPALRPALSSVEWDATICLARRGGLFFVQQCLGLVYYLSDNLVISHVLGAPAVAQFAVVQRLFSIGLLSQYIMLPLWPAFREAFVSRDFGWARDTLRLALRLNLIIGILGGSFLLLISQKALKAWAGMEVPPVDALRLGFVVWLVLAGYIATMNAFLNQPGLMKRHLVCFGLGTALAVTLKFILIFRWGVPGVVWGTIAGYSIGYTLPCMYLSTQAIDARLREAA